MSLTAPPKDCPPAYGGCTCACHRQPGIMHFAPCCWPSKLDMPTDPEWYREKTKFEEGSDVSAGVPDAPAMVEPLNTKVPLTPIERILITLVFLATLAGANILFQVFLLIRQLP